MDVIELQRADLGAANAGGVENFEDGSVPQAQRRGGVGLLQNAFDFLVAQDGFG